VVKKFDDPVRDVVNGPDHPIAYLRWAKFAECMIDSDIDKEIWTKLLKSLTKGFFIVMRTGFNPPGVNRPKMLTDEEIKKLREEIDKLTTAQELKDKLMEGVKEAKSKKIVSAQRQIEMMPGLAMSAAVQSFSANTANALPAKVTATPCRLTSPTNCCIWPRTEHPYSGMALIVAVTHTRSSERSKVPAPLLLSLAWLLWRALASHRLLTVPQRSTKERLNQENHRDFRWWRRRPPRRDCRKL
jgi:hypothetical protein